jgi:hypothetical protein
MVRKLLKRIGWTAAGLAGLVVVLYLALVAINWWDREPSAAAKHLAQVAHDRPAVADADNAYFYLQRWEQNPDRRVKLPAPVEAFLATCRPANPECAAAFDRADGLFAQWSAADGELLAGYMELSARSGWHEGTVFTEESIPRYVGPMNGQKLLLLRARELAKQGDAEQVRALLERDLRFWRMVLHSSDIVVSKMMAAGALTRHFEWGSLVLRSLPASRQAAAIPAGWRTGLSAAERSMERCMAGEWLFSTSILRRLPSEYFGVTSEHPIGRGFMLLARPLYQPQDTINRYAEHNLDVARAFAVPLDAYPRVVAEVRERERQAANDLFPYGSVYNLPGAWFFAIMLASSDTTSYYVRVGDIEGVRQAALTAALLRASGVAVKDVAAALGNVEQRDPYTHQPFAWNDPLGAIVFRGLQSGERGEHRIYY